MKGNNTLENKEIACEANGTNKIVESCKSDEWCAGNSDEKYSTRLNRFCEKGDKIVIIRSISVNLYFSGATFRNLFDTISGFQ